MIPSKKRAEPTRPSSCTLLPPPKKPKPKATARTSKESKEKKPSTPEKQIFAGVTALIIAKSIGRVQLDIIRDHFSRRGAVLVNELTPDVTHVLTKLHLSQAILHCGTAAVAKNPTARFYSVDWVTESLRLGARAPEADFLLGQTPLHLPAVKPEMPPPPHVTKSDRSVSEEKLAVLGSTIDWEKELDEADSSCESEGTPEQSPRRLMREQVCPELPSTPSPTKRPSSPLPWLRLSPRSSASPQRPNDWSKNHGKSAGRARTLFDTRDDSGDESDTAAQEQRVLAFLERFKEPPKQIMGSQATSSSSLEPPNLSPDLTQPTLTPPRSSACVLDRNIKPESNPFFAALFPSYETSHDLPRAGSPPVSPVRVENSSVNADILEAMGRVRREFSDSEDEEREARHPKLKILEKLEENSRALGDKWRSYAYRKSVSALKACPRRIDSSEDARRLKGVGASIAVKIGEILETGHLRKAENADEMTTVCAVFSKIWGAGPETVKKWYAKGHRTLRDLQLSSDLNHQQRAGLAHYDEFQLRIPRAEVAAMEKIVKETAQSIDPGYLTTTCGSYRRGKPDCGDIDVLLTHVNGSSLDGFLKELVRRLHSIDFLTDDLTTKSEDKYFGVCRLPDHPHRRIDFQLIAVGEWPFALLYFTGSDHFNRSMRLWAKRNGYSLSEHSLVPRITEDMKGAPIPLHTEEEIFQALGLKCITHSEFVLFE